MLSALGAPRGALVVMDRGIATEDRVTWLRDSGYRYLVVSRERRRRFDADAAVAHGTRTGRTVHLHKVVSRDSDEVRLYCYSPERGRQGARHRRALREALRAGADGTVRRPVATAHAQEARPGLRAHRPAQGRQPRRGAALRRRRRPRRRRRRRRRGDLRPPSAGRHDGHPSGRVLPAQQRDRLGRGHPVAHLHHADRPRGRVPLAQVRARAATHPPPQSRCGPRATCSSP